MTTIGERVAAGAQFLDEHDPGWWREDVDRAIDLDALDLSEPDRCVLGQRCPLEVLADYLDADADELSAIDAVDGYLAYGAFLSGIATAGEIGPWARELGFTFTYQLDETVAGDWDALTAEWRRVIAERRAAA